MDKIMKIFMKALVTTATLLAGTAMAQTYTLPDGVIGELTLAGGLRPSEMPAAQGVRIFEDGKAVFFEDYDDGRHVESEIAVIAASRITALRNQTADFTVDELVQDDPEAPGCFDAPGLTYVGRNGAGVAVALMGRYACKDYHRADYASSSLPEVLDGLYRLGQVQ
jgi:hypothetical protein